MASGKVPEGLVLLFVRIAVAGIFWRSGRTKIAEGSAFQISDATYFLFDNEYSAVPCPATSRQSLQPPQNTSFPSCW